MISTILAIAALSQPPAPVPSIPPVESNIVVSDAGATSFAADEWKPLLNISSVLDNPERNARRAKDVEDGCTPACDDTSFLEACTKEPRTDCHEVWKGCPLNERFKMSGYIFCFGDVVKALQKAGAAIEKVNE